VIEPFEQRSPKENHHPLLDFSPLHRSRVGGIERRGQNLREERAASPQRWQNPLPRGREFHSTCGMPAGECALVSHRAEWAQTSPYARS